MEEVRWDQTVMRLDISLRRSKLIITGGGFIPFLSSFWAVLFCSMRTPSTNNTSSPEATTSTQHHTSGLFHQASSQLVHFHQLFSSGKTHELWLSPPRPTVSSQQAATHTHRSNAKRASGSRNNTGRGALGSRQRDGRPSGTQIIAVVLVLPPSPSKRGLLRGEAEGGKSRLTNHPNEALE